MSKSQLQSNNTRLASLIDELKGKAAGGGGSGGGTVVTGTFSVMNMGMFDPSANEYLLTPSVPFDVTTVKGIIIIEKNLSIDSNVLGVLYRTSNEQNFDYYDGRITSDDYIVAIKTPVVNSDGSITAYGLLNSTITYIAF